MDTKDNLNVYKYIINSSTEVYDVVSKLKEIDTNNVLIHIISVMHNTVLIHKLEKELDKLFPDTKIEYLKTDDKSSTILKLYSLDKIDSHNKLNQEVIEELSSKLTDTQADLKQSRTNALQRYFTDHLTDLPNIYQLRKDFFDNDKAGLVFIKIDNFSVINNFYGFIIGDFILEKVGEFLSNKINEHKVYRHACEEFVVLLEKNLSFYEYKIFLEELYDDLKNLTIEYQSNKIYVDLTLAACATKTNDDIFSKVSMALNYANANNLPFWIYEDRMKFENEYEKNLELSVVVKNAVENSKIVPYFQPIVDNETMEVTMYESLTRLIDENDNVISEDTFIDIAKKIKVYNKIIKTSIDKTFEAFEDNQYEFSINISVEDIMNSEIFNFLINKLESSSISNRATFELLESENIKDFTKVDSFVKEAKRHGSKIAIDNFGHGYSDFLYIASINVDYIKIDASLIDKIDEDKNSYMVVECIVNFCKKFGIKSIAEHVHSSIVIDKVKELGIDYSQGVFIDKPSIGL